MSEIVPQGQMSASRIMPLQARNAAGPRWSEGLTETVTVWPQGRRARRVVRNPLFAQSPCRRQGETCAMGDQSGSDAAAARRAMLAKRWREAHPEYFKEYFRSERCRERDAKRKATPEYRAKEAARSKKRAASPEYKAKAKIYHAKYNASRDLEKDRAKQREYWKRPEVKAAQRSRIAKIMADPVKAAARRERRRLWALRWSKGRYRDGPPAYRLQRRMSAAVRRCLRGNKLSGSKWLNLVGYTAEELHAHIEKQFVPKMGWHNMPKWHIDHIVPLASFKFETADDPEFKAAWALTNLRPLWGPDNVRKQARREHLL